MYKTHQTRFGDTFTNFLLMTYYLSNGANYVKMIMFKCILRIYKKNMFSHYCRFVINAQMELIFLNVAK